MKEKQTCCTILCAFRCRSLLIFERESTSLEKLRYFRGSRFSFALHCSLPSKFYANSCFELLPIVSSALKLYIQLVCKQSHLLWLWLEACKITLSIELHLTDEASFMCAYPVIPRLQSVILNILFPHLNTVLITPNIIGSWTVPKGEVNVAVIRPREIVPSHWLVESQPQESLVSWCLPRRAPKGVQKIVLCLVVYGH